MRTCKQFKIKRKDQEKLCLQRHTIRIVQKFTKPVRWRQKEGSHFRSFQRFPPHKCLESPMFEDLKVWFYWIPSAALPAYLIAKLLQQRLAIIAITITIGVIIIHILILIIMTIMLVCNRAEQCVCNGDRVWQDIRCHHCQQLSIHPPKKILLMYFQFMYLFKLLIVFLLIGKHISSIC